MSFLTIHIYGDLKEVIRKVILINYKLVENLYMVSDKPVKREMKKCISV